MTVNGGDQGLIMGSRSSYGSMITLRRFDKVGEVIVHGALFWIGGKRMWVHTYFYLSPQLLPLPLPLLTRRHQLLKLIATRWYLMAGAAAVTLHIASQTIEIEVVS